MAKQHLLPVALGKVLKNRGTPWVAIAATTLVAMALTITGDLATLAKTVVLLLLFVFLSTNLAAIVLRKDNVNHRHFTVALPIPYLGLASCLLLMSQQDAAVWLRAGLLIVVGVLLHFSTRLFSSSRRRRAII